MSRWMKGVLGVGICLVLCRSLPLSGDEGSGRSAMPGTPTAQGATLAEWAQAPPSLLAQTPFLPREVRPNLLRRRITPAPDYLMPRRNLQSERSPIVTGSTVVTPNYRLGISLRQVDDTLRSQLRLAPQVGLVVSQVVENSPASQMGLQRHDVLTTADGQALTHHEQLIQAVQRAGADGRVITLGLIRAGVGQTVSLLPFSRAAVTTVSPQVVTESAPTPAAALPTTADEPAGFSILATPAEAPSASGPAANTETEELRKQVEQLQREVDALLKAAPK